MSIYICFNLSFDRAGYPVNPLDIENNVNNNANPIAGNNIYVSDVACKSYLAGPPNTSTNIATNIEIKEPSTGTSKRSGSFFQNLSGLIGSFLIQKLTDPVQADLLDSWIDADGQLQSNAVDLIQ